MDKHFPHKFPLIDHKIVFEFAWTLLAQRQYAEAGKMFIKLTSMNNWSPPTYHYIAAGARPIGSLEFPLTQITSVLRIIWGHKASARIDG